MPRINVDEAARGIYIDFEGGGAVRTAFLGVLWVDDDEKRVFRQDIFDEALWPVVAKRNLPNSEHWQPADLTETLEGLRELAEGENRMVFAYSEYERNRIEEHLPEGELYDWWMNGENLVNARPIAKRWKTLNRPSIRFPPREGQTSEWHSLANYLALIEYEVPTEYGPGVVAAAIDQTRTELIATDGAAPLSEEAGFGWQQAVMHNFHDCNGMRQLMIKCGTESPRTSVEAQETRRWANDFLSRHQE